jgi:hypothetical protein
MILSSGKLPQSAGWDLALYCYSPSFLSSVDKLKETPKQNATADYKIGGFLFTNHPHIRYITTMTTKQILKILGTLLFLYGVFGYIFPHWGHVQFTNNENLWHVTTGLIAIIMASASLPSRRNTLLVLALLYLVLGIYGFTLHHPTDFHIKHITAQLDTFDNYAHVVIGLIFSWFWLSNRK